MCNTDFEPESEALKKPYLDHGKDLIKAASKLGFEIELPPRDQDHNRFVLED
jgi:hypothetical protein